MKVGVAVKELHLYAVAAQVGGVPEVHWLVEVACHMYEDFQCEPGLGDGRRGVGQCLDLCLDGCHCIAGRIGRCAFVSVIGVYILVMPGPGVGEFRLMGGVVEPVGPVDH